MDRLNINLLPPELKDIKKREKKRSLIVRLSTGLLLLMVLLTGVLLVAVVLQNTKISQAKQNLEATRQQIDGYKKQEAIAVVLKTQINHITTLLNKEYPQSQAFTLISKLTPDQIKVLAFSVNKSNKVAIQGETQETTSLETFFNDLIDPKSNEGKISKVVVESLNLDRSGRIRFELTISTTIGLVQSKKT